MPENVGVTYLWTPPERFRTLVWIAFLLQALLFVPPLRWDRCVFLTDPPFLVVAAILGRWGGRHRAAYWWTMDLYPESLVAHGMLSVSGWAYRFLRGVNNWALGKTDGVVCLDELQMRRMRTYPALRGRQEDVRVIPPWDHRKVPEVVRSENRFLLRYGLQNAKVALYAGNLGQAHSFGELICGARVLTERGEATWKIVFVVRGAGRPVLEREARGMKNVLVLDYQSLDWTADLLRAADVHLITMRSGWEGVVVPSKLCGVLPTGRPILFIGPADCGTARRIWAGGEGEVLPPGAGGVEVADALLRLGRRGPHPSCSFGRRLAADLAEVVVNGRAREEHQEFKTRREV
jgi:hypothetical protein